MGDERGNSVNLVIERRNAAQTGGRCALALVLLLGVPAGAAAEELRIGGTGAALGTMRLLADEFTAANPDIHITTVPSLGSSGGIKAATAGAIDLAVTSRPMNESERKPGTVEVEYARTPFVFAVSAKSRVASITSAELADIYAGTKLAWPDGSRIRLVLRPSSDYDSELVRSISPEVAQGLRKAEERPGVQFSVSDQDAADDLERIPGAIGPSSLALIISEKRRLKVLKLDGREPTVANAASGAYRYHKQLFFVTGTRRPEAVERFVAFVQSPAGRRILASNGQWIP